MVSTIRPEELEQRVRGLCLFLTDIGKGEGPNKWFNLFKHGGKGRFNLDANCPMGKYSDDQHELVSSTLALMFGEEHSPDYICKVLFPEALIKIYMDVQGCQYVEAEEDLFKINLSQQSQDPFIQQFKRREPSPPPSEGEDDDDTDDSNYEEEVEEEEEAKDESEEVESENGGQKGRTKRKEKEK
ncbi:Hypothetical predicted protein [Paramuricea clavata]|uniref:Uncharacterized protein n=1 Tax=Paramuricea clavata TaxID=317549 RepID=A0A7D9ER39_PARCT|nr:Hypothetical predicted protein [Paramuricea clavata]